MNRTILGLLAITFMASVAVTNSGHAEDKPATGFLKVLTLGQTVTLKESYARYEITIMGDVKLGHKLIEVGTDFIVLEDLSGTIETHIPLASIKSVVKIRTLKK